MRSGIFESYGKYYLLSEVHDGHFGHLVKNGEVYNGITISASTNADDEGALSPGTINALKGLDYNFSGSPSVTGTQHVSNGQVTSGGSDIQPSTSQSQNSGSVKIIDPSSLLAHPDETNTWWDSETAKKAEEAAQHIVR